MFVLEAPNSFGSQIGKSLGKGLGNVAAEAAEGFVAKTRMNKENEFLKKLGIEAPGVIGPVRDQYISQKMKNLAQMESVGKWPGSQTGELPQEEDESNEFMIKPGQERKKAQTQKNNVYREKVMSPAEEQQFAETYFNQKKMSGNPVSDTEALAYAYSINDNRKKYRAEQENAGLAGEDALRKQMKNPEEEFLNVARKKAEELYGQNLSANEQKEAMSRYSKNLANKVRSIEKVLPPARAWTKLKDMYLGSDIRDDERSINDIRDKLAPLKEEFGPDYFDVARNMIKNTGRHPEEVENIVSSLSEPAQKTIAEMPNLKKESGYFERFPQRAMANMKKGLFGTDIDEEPLNENQELQFRENFKNLLTKDPNVNLILARRDYEKKGVGWKEFRNAVEDYKREGLIQETPEYVKQSEALVEPPLHRLDKLMYKFNLTGK